MKRFKIRDAVLLLFLSACVSGPTTEKKHSLDALNGENYDVGNGGVDRVIIPIVKTKQRSSQVTGEVRILSGIAPTPLRFVLVELYDKENKLVSKNKTDSDGKFDLSGVFANGEYRIKLASPKYTAEQSLTIKDYITTGVLVTAIQAHGS